MPDSGTPVCLYQHDGDVRRDVLDRVVENDAGVLHPTMGDERSGAHTKHPGWKNPVLRSLRNLAVRKMLSSGGEKQIRKLYSID